MSRKPFGFGKVTDYINGKVDTLRAAPHHVQRTAATVAAAVGTAAIVGLALLLQATIGTQSSAQLAAPAGTPSLSDAVVELKGQLKLPEGSVPKIGF